jgi:STE24 endopeptidase
VNEDKASRYHRLKRQTGIASVAASVALLLVLAASSGSLIVRDWSERLAAPLVPVGAVRLLSVVFYIAWLAILNEAVGLPFGFYSGFVLERRYGLSKQSLRSWLFDQVKSLALGLMLCVLAGSVVYLFIAHDPTGWWMPAALVFALLIIGLANVGPLVLLPLFYSVTPLARESLRARLVALGERAGARVLDAYEWGLGAKTSKANAALTGVGRARRILVSDTMLAQYSDDEIEVVLAHELAHHVHGDIWTGIAFEAALILLGFFCAARLLLALAPMAGLRGPSDVAGLPILLLAAGAVSLVMVPAAHALSRAHERRADEFALRLTRNSPAFISAMRRLAAQNLAEDDPSPLVQWLFYSHPPIRERIAAAQSFKP